MKERLFASALLWKADLISKKEYNSILDAYFSEEPENDTLLELEYCSADISKTLRILKDLCLKHRMFKSKDFGKIICEAMETIYNQPDTSLQDFSKKAYSLWNILPDCRYEIPLIELSYISAPPTKKEADWADATYRTMFSFYRENPDKPVKTMNSRSNIKELHIKEFTALPSGSVSPDWDKIETLLGFGLHDSAKSFYSRAFTTAIKGCIDFSDANFVIPTGNEPFDTWFSYIKGAAKFKLAPAPSFERAARFIRDSYQLWTGGNKFGRRIRIGELFTDIGEITLLINNDTGAVEWVDCGYGYFEDYNKNPNGIFAENSEAFLDKLCCCSM